MLNGPTCSSLEKIWHIHVEVLPSADNERCADSTAGLEPAIPLAALPGDPLSFGLMAIGSGSNEELLVNLNGAGRCHLHLPTWTPMM